ncbi:MAG TPA: glycosyltransferase family 1 protein, partial [Thermoanaerobaculia bacterium]|nr:glycosyltransferase family 1 protein [Thermoanaerobaculia bacterium]
TAVPKGTAEAATDGARPYVLFLGTLEPRKNVSRLVDAMESIWDARPDFPDLVLAGDDGWGLSGFDTRLRSSRHAARIRLQGYASAAEAGSLLRNARVLAYPSLYEGFGLPVLEAMAEGVPVVASSRAALPEVVGDAGLLPDPENVEAIAAALVKAETDAKWRRDARLKGFARAEKFSWTNAARAMRGLFEEAIA